MSSPVARSGDRPRVEVVGGGVIAEVASRRAGEAEPAGIIERLCQHHGIAQQRRTPGGAALQDAPDSHEQSQRELVDAPFATRQARGAPPRSSGQHPRVGGRLAGR